VNVKAPFSSNRSEEAGKPRGSPRSKQRSEHSPSTHVLCRLCRRWFQAITYSHLLHKHGIEDPQTYKDEFSLKKITADEVCRKIAAGKFIVDRFDLDYIRENWRKKSLKEITSYLGIGAPTVRVHARRMGLGLLVETWNRPKIVISLRRARRRGEALHSGSARHTMGRLYKAAIKHYGSWRKALEAAGISYDKVARRAPFENWSRDRILQEVRTLARSGRERDYVYIHQHHSKLYAAARNQFGNWREALRLSGHPK
jgi:hypothetical protein